MPELLQGKSNNLFYFLHFQVTHKYLQPSGSYSDLLKMTHSRPDETVARLYPRLPKHFKSHSFTIHLFAFPMLSYWLFVIKEIYSLKLCLIYPLPFNE